MCKIIAVFSNKGGVGKTTTAINVSSCLSNLGKKTLLVDIDPQANATKGLGFDPSLVDNSIFDVLLNDCDIAQGIAKTISLNLHLLKSKLIFQPIDFLFANLKENPYMILKEKLEIIKKEYDFILIDCPSTLGFLSLNALNAADSILIPVQCEYFAMDSISSILALVSNIQITTNPNLEIEGFVMTMYDSKTILATEIATEVRGLFKENTFSTFIPRNISIPESSLKGIPVIMFRPTSISSLAYMSLTKEILEKV